MFNIEENKKKMWPQSKAPQLSGPQRLGAYKLKAFLTYLEYRKNILKTHGRIQKKKETKIQNYRHEPISYRITNYGRRRWRRVAGYGPLNFFPPHSGGGVPVPPGPFLTFPASEAQKTPSLYEPLAIYYVLIYRMFGKRIGKTLRMCQISIFTCIQEILLKISSFPIPFSIYILYIFRLITFTYMVLNKRNNIMKILIYQRYGRI